MKLHSADRTVSSRRRAGSRRNKKFRTVKSRRSDSLGLMTIGYGSKPDHASRAVDIGVLTTAIRTMGGWLEALVGKKSDRPDLTGYGAV